MLSSTLQNLPIKKKLILFILGITGSALFLFTLLSVLAQVDTMRQAMLNNKSTLSEAIADLSTATLSFSDATGAQEILMAFDADPDVEQAAIFDSEGAIFASYLRSEPVDQITLALPSDQAQQSFILRNGEYKLELVQPIYLEHERIGYLYMLANTDRMVAQILGSILLLIVSMVLILLVTVLVSARLQFVITRPVSFLAKTARRIAARGDYSERVEKSTGDEIGQLIDDFNMMLDVIQERDAELQKHRQNLEYLVEQRTQELRKKRDEALAAAKAKSEFLANMSHEIRTPMNGVIGVLSLLHDAPLTDEFRRLLDTATRSADSLLLIINDILDFSKIDAGKITFESIVFDIRELMEETSELYLDTVNLKGLDLTCLVPVDLPCKVMGDPTRLRQVLTNLLSNAVKFTDQGEVKLSVACGNRDAMQQELLFTIEDTGIGIPEESIDNLFEKFTQADGSTTRKYGGTGLGLSVCRQLVEKQGGEIGVKSRLGFGAKFWFSLPFFIVEDSQPIIPYNKLAGKRFLLVDDNITNCLVLEHYLTFCDAKLRACGDASSLYRALERAQSRDEPYDALLIDYTLPRENGLQVAEYVTRHYENVVPERIILSSTTFTRSQLQKAGIRDLLLKPVRQMELYRILANEASEQVGQIARSPKKTTKKTPELFGSVLLVDDEPINQKIALTILRKFGLKADVASTGYDAVRMTSENRYSIVLMDIQMPELSGYEATQLIREREKELGEDNVVIIAMTANALDSTRKRCFEVGMDDFFTKPIKPEVLAERLSPWLRREQQDTEVFDPARLKRVAAQAAQEQAIWDAETALGFVGNDDDLFRELVELFLGRNDKLLTAIDSAIKGGEPEAVRDAAHAYKGAVNHFAAPVVRDLALAIESIGNEEELQRSGEIFNDLQVEAGRLNSALRDYLATADNPAKENPLEESSL